MNQNETEFGKQYTNSLSQYAFCNSRYYLRTGGINDGEYKYCVYTEFLAFYCKNLHESFEMIENWMFEIP
jgi:hypothetical protein